MTLKVFFELLAKPEIVREGRYLMTIEDSEEGHLEDETPEADARSKV